MEPEGESSHHTAARSPSQRPGTCQGLPRVPVPGLEVQHGPGCGNLITGPIELKIGPDVLREWPERWYNLPGDHCISEVCTRRRGAWEIWIMAEIIDIERPQPPWGCCTCPDRPEAGGRTPTKSCESVWAAHTPVLGWGTRKPPGSDIWIMGISSRSWCKVKHIV